MISWGLRVLPALLSALLLTACGLSGPARGQDPGAQPAVATLRAPLLEAVEAIEAVELAAETGDLAGSRRAYREFHAALGEFLGPVSLKDPAVAQAVANANSRLRDLLSADETDAVAVIAEARRAGAATRAAAHTVGLAVTARAGATVGAPAGEGLDTKPVVQAVQGEPTKTVTISASEYRFRPARIEVDRGTRLTVRLVNQGRLEHEWELDAYGVEIKPIKPGQTGEVTFVTDKPGTYEFVCDLDHHKERGMRGYLTVK